MELWIRNQNKVFLGKVDSVFIIQHFAMDIDGNTNDNLIYYSINTDDQLLGEYKTKERALEVLDEIQSILMPMIHYEPIVKEKIDYSKPYIEKELVGSKCEIQEISTYLYEMPEE